MPKKEKRARKAGSAGRFGPRYGTKIRQDVRAIEREQRSFHKCPQCGSMKVRRVSSGIWKCRRCETVFTGKAYVPEVSEIRTISEESAGESLDSFNNSG